MSSRFKAVVEESDYEDNDDGNEDIENKDTRNKRKRCKARRLLVGGCNSKNGLRRAKKLVFYPFNKFQKLINKKYTRSSSSSSSSHTAKSTSNLSRNIKSSIVGVGKSYRCLCFSKPQSLDAPFHGVDTNHDDLKSLIEKNDFFSKECNTHFGN